MSITIKKVSFGNATSPFALSNYFNPMMNQSNIQNVGSPQMQTNINSQTQAVTPNPPAPVYQPVHNNVSGDKILAYVSSGLALTALGVTTVSAVRGRNAQKTAESLERFEQRISTLVSEKIANLDQRVQSSVNLLDSKITKEAEERVGLGKYQDGIIGDVKTWLKNVQAIAEEKGKTVIIGKGTNLIAKEVEINGSKMNLATIMHGYGVETAPLQAKLRAEAAQRMFGLVDRSNIKIPEVPVVRVPTSEFKGIASTGGLSVVPKEVIANLGAFINSKQQSRLIVDMPMYLGEVANNLASGQQTYYALEAAANGKYSLVSKAIYQGNSDKVVIKNLEKIADMEVPIYDDAARTMQNVEVYMAKGLTQQVDYNLLRKYLSPEDLAVYNDNIAQYLNHDFGAVQAKLKPLRKVLGGLNKKEAEMIKASPLKKSLEDIEKVSKTIEKIEAHRVDMLNGNNVQEIKKAYKDALVADGKEVNELNLMLKIEELHTKALRLKDKLKSDYAEALRKAEADNPEFKAVRDKIRETTLSIKSITDEFSKNQGQIYDKGLLRVSGDVDGHVKAEIVFDGVFYKNEKFDMKGPRFDGTEKDKTIYNNRTINSGETERFSYFNKYFYEFLTRSKESTNERLGADLIIGNDWHTGGISAMTRLLTKAKEAVGDLTPQAAEKIYNTPVITIMHNAQEAGRSGHSNSKLFNILFGEHASMIVENANMPDVYNVVYNAAIKSKLSPEEAAKRASQAAKEIGLPAKCWNGLMHSGAVDPQAMAVSYSDVIVPVSDKYMEEIATQGVYGRENFELFRLRKFATDHADWFNKQKTMVGITNGCDKINNILTEEGARLLESQLKLTKKLKVYDGSTSVLDWHNYNKEVILDRVRKDVLDKANPMKISLPELTDLTGVNADTMVVSTAGRIVDQKGLDIFAGAIEEILRNHKFPDGNYPVFYAQGKGGENFVKMILAVKEKVAKSPELGGEAAAKRIVFANLFSEPGRYDACKLMSDFSIMSSWFEPCGLVHKEIVAKSGAIPIVNETGGLTSGLTNGVDAIFSKFRPAEPSKDAVRGENVSNFANAMWDAYTVFKDKEKLGKMMTNSYNNDFSWLVDNGPMAQYVRIFTDLKVLKPQILGEAA